MEPSCSAILVEILIVGSAKIPESVVLWQVLTSIAFGLARTTLRVHGCAYISQQHIDPIAIDLQLPVLRDIAPLSHEHTYACEDHLA